MTPRELIQRMQLTAVKARSNAQEGETLDVAILCDPFTYGDHDMSLLTVSTRMLERDATVMDAYNLLILAERSPSVSFVYSLRWEDDLPIAMDFLRENL